MGEVEASTHRILQVVDVEVDNIEATQYPEDDSQHVDLMGEGIDATWRQPQRLRTARDKFSGCH
jgi:hypothetical protein